MYIAFEGIDTVGKSTQLQRLKEQFPDALITKEPGGTTLGKKIRTILLESENLCDRSELLLFLADRAEHTQKVIRPNLNRLILSDRSFLSGIAYALQQGTFALDTLLWLNRFATDNLLPNRIVMFTIDASSLQARLSQKSHDTIEARGIDYMLGVQQHLLELLDLLAIEHCTIDATQPIETITQQIADYIKECL